jgi:uncharacterized protein
MQKPTGLGLEFPPFRPARWLRNGHLQTVIAARKPRRWGFGWEKSETLEIDLGSDGKLRAEASWQPGRRSDSPALFLLHGLEGSAQSHYLIGLSKKAFHGGFHTVRINMRNCGGTEHLTPTLYCAGLSQDVIMIVRHLQERIGITEIYAAAVSLGANILLKFLGEQGARASDYVRATAVLSPPIDLRLCALKMLEPQNWFYQRYFVRNLKERIRRKAALFPKIADLNKLERVQTIYEFDDVVTAPHFGFGSAENYYRIASSAPLLKSIRVPTLLIQSKDDPMIPFQSFRDARIEENPFLRLVATEYGGHTGFLGLRPAIRTDQDAYWGECRAVQFLSALVRERGWNSVQNRNAVM